MCKEGKVMGYVIVGGVCLVIGATIGIFIMALCVASKNAEISIENMEKEEEQR